MVILGGGLLSGCGSGSDSTSGTGDETAPAAGAGGPAQETSGEQSVEEFGSEATGSEKEDVLAAEQGYLSAVGNGDFEEACSFVAGSVTESLQAAGGPGGGEGCEAFLPRLLSSAGRDAAADQLGGQIVKVRIEKNNALVIFKAPGARLYVFPMARESGEWKVGTLVGSILAPSAATLGQ